MDYDTQQHCQLIHKNHSELQEWGTIAIFHVFSGYCRDILEISWAPWKIERDVSLLGYIYIVQKLKSDHHLVLQDVTCPLITELADYSETTPWINDSGIPLWMLTVVEQKN